MSPDLLSLYAFIPLLPAGMLLAFPRPPPLSTVCSGTRPCCYRPGELPHPVLYLL